jgi:Domain of unknown function (DUF892)
MPVNPRVRRDVPTVHRRVLQEQPPVPQHQQSNMTACAGSGATRRVPMNKRIAEMGLFTKDIKTMNDLFMHPLQDIYYAEKQLVKALPPSFFLGHGIWVARTVRGDEI